MSFSREDSEIVDGVVQLRFANSTDQVNEIGASDLAEVLQGLVAFSAELARAGEFGEGPAPRVRVRAPKEGSFILEAVVWFQENPIGTAAAALTGIAGAAAAKEIGTAAGKAIAEGIGIGLRKLRGERPVGFEHLDGGTVKVDWPDGSVSEVREETWTQLQAMKKPTRNALSKILTPLNTDSDTLEVRDASVSETTDEILSTPADAVANRTDYLTAIFEPDDSFSDERIFETEATLGSIDFSSNERWKVLTPNDGSRTATIEDREFLRRLDQGEALHKGDIFWLKIRETVSKERGKNTSTEWAVLEVTRRRAGGEDDIPSTPAPPSIE